MKLNIEDCNLSFFINFLALYKQSRQIIQKVHHMLYLKDGIKTKKGLYTNSQSLQKENKSVARIIEIFSNINEGLQQQKPVA